MILSAESVKMQEEKCYYYNKGYCKYKQECTKYHPTEDCKSKCVETNCKFRHRQMCKNGTNCYFKNKKCEYLHSCDNTSEVALAKFLDVPMTFDDNEERETHKVILAALSPNNKDQYEKENIDLKMLNNKYKEEIEELKQKLDEESKDKEKQIKKKDEYKKDLEEEKQKTMYMNLNKIKIEDLKKEIDETKAKRLEKESEHKILVEKLKTKIKTLNLDKAYNPEPEPMEEVKEFKCDDYDFKTNWRSNMNDHKSKCKKTKKNQKIKKY